jgi:glycosyltransferase involved in cell wall biosynthesis
VYKGLTVAVVVPAYNESALITKTVSTVPDFVDRIIVVDDASSDDTADRAHSVADERMQVIRHDVNRGVGGAIVTGHRAAMDAGADVDVVMAGDAQMDPAYLPALLDPIAEDGYGFAKANRFFAMDSFAGMPRARLMGSVALSFFTKAASGYWHLFDPQNGYTAVRTDVLRRIPLDRLRPGYSFENDLLINLNILGVRAKDVPVPAVYGEDVSSMRLHRVAPQIARLLFLGFWRRIFWKYVLWSFSPIALLLFSGLALTLFGLAVGVFVIVNSIGEQTASAGTVLLAVAPVLLGLHLMISALVLDIQESPG